MTDKTSKMPHKPISFATIVTAANVTKESCTKTDVHVEGVLYFTDLVIYALRRHIESSDLIGKTQIDEYRLPHFELSGRVAVLRGYREALDRLYQTGSSEHQSQTDDIGIRAGQAMLYRTLGALAKETFDLAFLMAPSCSVPTKDGLTRYVTYLPFTMCLPPYRKYGTDAERGILISSESASEVTTRTSCFLVYGTGEGPSNLRVCSDVKQAVSYVTNGNSSTWVFNAHRESLLNLRKTLFNWGEELRSTANPENTDLTIHWQE